jgi:hypothetical protein
MENSVSSSYLSGYDMAGVNTKSRIYHAAGVVAHTGSLSFDLTEDLCIKLRAVLQKPREFKYQIRMSGNDSGWSMQECVIQSISLSGSPNGLVSGSLTFASALPPTMFFLSEEDKRDLFSAGLVPYWHTGWDLVRNWSLDFSLATIPKHSNGDVARSYGLFGIKAHSPKYLYLGECLYNLKFSCFQKITSGFTVKLGADRIFSCRDYVVVDNSFSVGGAEDINIFNYAVSSHAIEDHNENIVIY